LWDIKRVSRECSEICLSELHSLPSYTASGINLIYNNRTTTSLLIKMHQLAWPSGKVMGKRCSSRSRMLNSRLEGNISLYNNNNLKVFLGTGAYAKMAVSPFLQNTATGW